MHPIISDFAMGMANAKTGKIVSAEYNLQSLRSKTNDDILKIKFAPHTSSSYECATNALHTIVSNSYL